MTPGQARIALSSFLLVTAGVVFNALFLQARPVAVTKSAAERVPAKPVSDRARKAPAAATPAQPIGFTSSDAAQHPLRIARFAPEASKPDPLPAGAGREAGPDTIRAIQRELKLRGYGPLPGDGSMGLTTRAAIMAYEYDQGLALEGQASERLLRRILLGAAEGPADAGSAGSAAGTVRTAEAQQVVRAAQQWLAALGYQPGRSDGQLGAETVSAIRDFEMDKGLVPRGRISAELVTRLSEAAAPRATSAR
jgi:peptidoglycan hydrolase-like protein with peptidoglycan-binding domain